MAQAGHDPVRRPRRPQDRRGEHLRRADREPDRRAQRGLPREPTPIAARSPTPWTSLAADPNIAVRARHEGPQGQGDQRHHARADDARLVRDGRLGEDEGGRRRAAVADRPLPQLLGLQPRRRPARLRAVPGRPAEDRRRRDPLHGVRHHGRRRRPVQPRPHGDARGRPLAQPAPHLGRHQRLLGLRPGVGHPARPGAELRQAGLAAHLLQQRPQRRHVHGLHGLRRRRRHVHVHPGAGRAHERDARGAAQEARAGSSGDRPGAPPGPLGPLPRGGHRRRDGLPLGGFRLRLPALARARGAGAAPGRLVRRGGAGAGGQA